MAKSLDDMIEACDMKGIMSPLMMPALSGVPIKPPPPTVTFGADPEFLLWDMEQGKIVSALDVLKNDKYHPVEFDGDIRMYADNVLVELAFPPSDSIQGFIDTIRKSLRAAHKHLGNRYRLVAQAAFEYDKEELKNPKAWEGGCSPNFDVYSQSANLPPKFKDGLRTGSFHLHIGSPEFKEVEAKNRIIKALDCVLGLASVVFDADPSSKVRRRLYGKAGEFRPTPYGVEYRVLGPYGMRSPELVMLVMKLVSEAIRIHRASAGSKALKLAIKQESIKESINSGDRTACMNLIAQFMPPHLYQSICTNRVPDLYRDWRIMETTVEPPMPELGPGITLRSNRFYTMANPKHDDTF